MLTLFKEAEYETIHRLVFRPDYPGYRPDIVEAPNGDGNLDHTKKYAHISPKYLQEAPAFVARDLVYFYNLAFRRARNVAKYLGVPSAFLPDHNRCALRIIDYPPGAGSALHTDFDLFTLLCFRDPDCWGERGGLARDWDAGLNVGERLSSGMHYGELLEIVCPEFKATPHWVSPGGRQKSIVFFAIPAWESRLPTGQTVGEWLDERKSRSRVPATEVQS